MELEDRDLTDFDKNVMDFLDLCKTIMKVYQERSVIKKENPIVKRLDSYIRVYNKSDPVDHLVYFEKLLNGNKRMIMLGPQRDAWIKDGNIVITFGDEIGLKNIKIHMSTIYQKACEIRDEVEEELEGLKGLSIADKKETLYPKKFLISLYKIFESIVISENEKKKLATHISDLEKEIGIKTKAAESSNDAISGLFDMASNMAEQMTGKKLDTKSLAGKGDLNKMLGDVLNNPQTKNMIGSMMQNFQNTEGLSDMVSNLVGNLGNVNGGQNGESSNNDNNVESNVQEIESTDQNVDVNDEFADFE